MKKIRKISELFCASVLILGIGFFACEPYIIRAIDDTAVVSVTITEEIAITSPGDTTFSATIPGITGNPGAPVTASLTWTVRTVNATGFAMTVKASQTNALVLNTDADYYFTDYTPAGAVPDYNWGQPAATAAEMGFTVEPETAGDTVQAFLDNGSNACNEAAGSQTANKCWFGFNGTTPVNVINRSTNTDSTGEAEVIKFQAESNAKFLKEGQYDASITVTATMNG